MKKMNYEQLQQEMKHILNEKRYEHTLGVAYTCAALAMCYGVDVSTARFAGLLHDNAKCMDDDVLLQLSKQYGLDITKAEYSSPYLLHAKVGAYLAKAKYGVEQDDIIMAIQYHTTGRPNMSLLEKIVFVADYIEPNRKKIEGLEEIRSIVFQNLDCAVAKILENTLAYLEEKANGDTSSIDEMTTKAYEYYKDCIS